VADVKPCDAPRDLSKWIFFDC